MRHFFRASTHQMAQSRCINRSSATPWLWQILGMTVFTCIGVTSEGLAQTTVSPASLTYSAVESKGNPTDQTITVSRTSSRTTTLTASDNATWLTVSPPSTSLTSTTPSKKLTVTVNTSLKGPGTYNANIRIRVGTWYTKTVPVTLIISPTTSSPPSTTSSATLTWDTVTGATVNGYKVYAGEDPNNPSQTINVGNVTSSTVNGLTIGRTYSFVVKAYNSAGESPPSNMVFLKVK